MSKKKQFKVVGLAVLGSLVVSLVTALVTKDYGLAILVNQLVYWLSIITSQIEFYGDSL